MDKTTIYLPRELLEELQAIARQTGRPRGEVIRNALLSFVAQQERPWPRTIGMGASDTIRGADDEVLLRQRWKRDW